MNAKEASEISTEANRIAIEKERRNEKLRIKQEKQFEIDLRTKYPKDFIKEKLLPEIEKAARAGNKLATASPWNKGDCGKIIVEHAKPLLEADGYEVSISSKFYDAYRQTSHFDEGDHSYEAYTEWIITVRW